MHLFYVTLMFCYTFVSVICFNFHIGKHGTRHATFERFDNTCGVKDVIIVFDYTGLRSEGNKVIMNNTLTVKQDIERDPTMTIRIDRCRNKENLDTCEYLYNYKVKSFCFIIESKSEMWSSFFSYYVPQYKCPIKKGVYKATNAVLDGSAMLLFPLDTWFWKVKIEVRDNETHKLITCMMVEARVARLV